MSPPKSWMNAILFEDWFHETFVPLVRNFVMT